MPISSALANMNWGYSRNLTSFYGVTKSYFQKVVGFVVLIHVFIFVLARFGLPSFKIAQRPDIVIEIGATPAASNGPSTPAASQNKSSPKDVVKDKPVLGKDAAGTQLPTPTTLAPMPPASAASTGPASAPTVDPDYKAAYLQNPKPAYPPLAFKMRIEGKVILVAEVLPNGQSGSVKIVESSGNEMLDKSALETVKKWKFTPARKDGVIVTQAVRIPITFSLKNR
jgi:protein TonB